MSSQQWEEFSKHLSPDLEKLLQLKKVNKFDEEIAKDLECSLKQVQKQWMDLLELAWKYRNWDGQKLPGKKSNLRSVKNSTKVRNISDNSLLPLAVS